MFWSTAGTGEQGCSAACQLVTEWGCSGFHTLLSHLGGWQLLEQGLLPALRGVRVNLDGPQKLPVF